MVTVMVDRRSVSFDSAGHELAGTLVIPERARSGALLISGSGPIDRDSNAKRMKIDVMAQVADRLAAGGIASFRYDKRGVGDSEGDYRSSGFHDNVADARSALTVLRGRLDDVFVVGHSEGALIGIELAAHDPTISGIVLLAGSAQNGEDILLWQMTKVADSIPKPVKWLIWLLRQDLARTQRKRLERIKVSTGDVMRIQLIRINARWFREFMAYEPAIALARVTLPVMAITGSKDIQVDPGDLERMAVLVNGSFTPHLAADVTHLLRTDDGPASVRTYKKQVKRPVDADVLDLVAGWIGDVAAVENGCAHESV